MRRPRATTSSTFPTLFMRIGWWRGGGLRERAPAAKKLAKHGRIFFFGLFWHIFEESFHLLSTGPQSSHQTRMVSAVTTLTIPLGPPYESKFRLKTVINGHPVFLIKQTDNRSSTFILFITWSSLAYFFFFAPTCLLLPSPPLTPDASFLLSPPLSSLKLKSPSHTTLTKKPPL